MFEKSAGSAATPCTARLVVLAGILRYGDSGSGCGTGPLTLGDVSDASSQVRIGNMRALGRQDIASPSSIILDGDVLIDSAGCAVRFLDIPVTLTGNRTITLDDSFEIQGEIGDGGNSYGLRIQPSVALASESVVLDGSNSFSGDLEVAPGVTVTLDDANALADTVTVRIEESGGVYGTLDMAQGVTVGRLFLDGVRQSEGTYGATGSAAQTKDNNFFAGTGVLTVLNTGSGTVLRFR